MIYQSTVKRQRTGPGSGTGTHSISSRPTRQDPGSSPTPIPSGLPRPISTSYGSASSRTFSGQSTSSSTLFTSSSYSTKVVSIVYNTGTGTIKEHAALGKDSCRRPEQRRKSFKPRQSVVGGLLAAAAAARRDSMGGMIEENEGEDVY
jgi:hypothetical protein